MDTLVLPHTPGVSEIPVALTAIETLPIDQMIEVLVCDPSLDLWLAADPTRADMLLAGITALSGAAFAAAEADARMTVSRVLCTLYDAAIADPASPQVANQFNPTLLEIRRRLERDWLAALVNALPPAVIAPPGSTICDRLRHMWAEHPVRDHALFDFLATSASRPQVEEMLRRDWALNVRFYDILVLSMVGAPLEARQELAKNFWDEMGRGDIGSSHVVLFETLVDTVPKTADHSAAALILGAEGLEGYNLFMLCAVNRVNYFKLLGLMAITELLDPSNYEKLLIGGRRVGFSESLLTYYGEHATIDIEHADGWLHNVIEPLIKKYPSAEDDILMGAALRLETCCRYYDALLQHLMSSVSERSK
jgi:hypothetical protein